MFQGTDTENHAINGATVQLGVQQRSGSHFQECVKMIQDGYIGRVSHCDADAVRELRRPDAADGTGS